MTALGWSFLTLIWTLLSALTGWCFYLVLSPSAKPHETALPPSGRM
ncbi:MAG: hypothetical protein HY553_16995 [Elusimicrobia bacterium]|nr:hypothetical protein [Elusimicrobiota bacterium]